MKILFNLALLLALLFAVFTPAGRDLAVDLFMYAHEVLTAYITGVLEDSL